MHAHTPPRVVPLFRPGVMAVFVAAMLVAEAGGVGAAGETRPVRGELEAAVRSRCGDCHCGGAKEGGLNLEDLLHPEGADGRAPPSTAERDRERWSAVWQNIRAGVMPPADQPRPTESEREWLVRAIETDVFGVDHARPDPGRVVLRRLNRFEYANTVRDLTGLDIAVIDDLPADDTGHGFDTIAAVLTVSPLLLEKYLAVATHVGERVADVRPSGGDGETPEYPGELRRLFPLGPPPGDEDARVAHRRGTIERLAANAFRRPADEPTVERLVAVAVAGEARHGTFEGGVATALTAVLASPKFLFRVESDADCDEGEGPVPIDEFSLASRLSYFLWATMPDDDLRALASRGMLREQLAPVVDRMIRDPRSEAFVASFAGQWLRVRDIETAPFSLKRIMEIADEKGDGRAQRHFDEKLRPAMRMETELLFAHVLRNGRPATDLLLGRETFLNADLAAHYGIPGVEGDSMRLVELPRGIRHGGVLAHGSVLAVTSTPSRTSPVKRGLFVLESLLGTPAPPAPPDIPSLEVSAKRAGEGASMLEVMRIHRQDAACAACHARMDPPGLALEEYDAIGRLRDGGQAVAGRLMTGEAFADTAELASVIARERRRDFHRCLVEKLFTYAIGRGVEVHDAPTVDLIVDRLESEGRLDAAIHGIVESVAFQRRRREARGVSHLSENEPSSSMQVRR